MNENLARLWETVGKEYNLGSMEDFSSRMATPENRLQFFQTVGKQYDLGTFGEFEGRIGARIADGGFGIEEQEQEKKPFNWGKSILAKAAETYLPFVAGSQGGATLPINLAMNLPLLQSNPDLQRLKKEAGRGSFLQEMGSSAIADLPLILATGAVGEAASTAAMGVKTAKEVGTQALKRLALREAVTGATFGAARPGKDVKERALHALEDVVGFVGLGVAGSIAGKGLKRLYLKVKSGSSLTAKEKEVVGNIESFSALSEVEKQERAAAIEAQLAEMERVRKSPAGAVGLREELAAEEIAAREAERMAQDPRARAIEEALLEQERLRRSPAGAAGLREELAAAEQKPSMITSTTKIKIEKEAGYDKGGEGGLGGVQRKERAKVEPGVQEQGGGLEAVEANRVLEGEGKKIRSEIESRTAEDFELKPTKMADLMPNVVSFKIGNKVVSAKIGTKINGYEIHNHGDLGLAKKINFDKAEPGFLDKDGNFVSQYPTKPNKISKTKVQAGVRGKETHPLAPSQEGGVKKPDLKKMVRAELEKEAGKYGIGTEGKSDAYIEERLRAAYKKEVASGKGQVAGALETKKDLTKSAEGDIMREKPLEAKVQDEELVKTPEFKRHALKKVYIRFEDDFKKGDRSIEVSDDVSNPLDYKGLHVTTDEYVAEELKIKLIPEEQEQYFIEKNPYKEINFIDLGTSYEAPYGDEPGRYVYNVTNYRPGVNSIGLDIKLKDFLKLSETEKEELINEKAHKVDWMGFRRRDWNMSIIVGNEYAEDPHGFPIISDQVLIATIKAGERAGVGVGGQKAGGKETHPLTPSQEGGVKRPDLKKMVRAELEKEAGKYGIGTEGKSDAYVKERLRAAYKKEVASGKGQGTEAEKAKKDLTKPTEGGIFREKPLEAKMQGEVKMPKGEIAEQVKTPEFKKWFGDWEKAPEKASKVVDESGKPLVVYHGTNELFDIFSIVKRGVKTNIASARKAFWFTDSSLSSQAYLMELEASLGKKKWPQYRNMANKETESIIDETRSKGLMAGSLFNKSGNISIVDIDRNELQKFITKYDNSFKIENLSDYGILEQMAMRSGLGSISGYFQGQLIERYVKEIAIQNGNLLASINIGKSPNIMRVYLVIKKPLIVDFGGDQYGKGQAARLISKAIRNGNDGVIFRNLSDGGKVSTHYAVFSPNQIKSSTGNRGTFDVGDANILHGISPVGAMAGIEKDDEGNWTYDPVRGAAGMLTTAALGKMTSTAIRQLVKDVKHPRFGIVARGFEEESESGLGKTINLSPKLVKVYKSAVTATSLEKREASRGLTKALVREIEAYGDENFNNLLRYKGYKAEKLTEKQGLDLLNEMVEGRKYNPTEAEGAEKIRNTFNKEDNRGPGGIQIDQLPEKSDTRLALEKIYKKTIRSGEAVLRKQGKAGNEMADMIIDAQNFSEVNAGVVMEKLTNAWDSAIKAMRKSEKGLSAENAEIKLRDILEGNGTATSPEVQAAVDLTRRYFKNVEERAMGLGEDFTILRADGTRKAWKARINYFPQYWDMTRVKQVLRTKREEIIKRIIEKDGGTPFDAEEKIRRFMIGVNERRGAGLQHERPDWIPEYARMKSPRAELVLYVQNAERRLTEAQRFGVKDEKIKDLISKIYDDGGDAGFARALFERYTGKDMQESLWQDLSKVVNSFQVLTKLTFASIANASQGVNALMFTNFKSLAKGIKAAANKEGRDFALKTGAALESTAREILEEAGGAYGSWAQKSLKYTGFIATERFNRILAANMGKVFIKDLVGKAVQRGSFTAKELRLLAKLRLKPEKILANKGLTERELLTSGKLVSDITQFRAGALEMPLFWTSPGGRIVTQFKKYAYNQTRFLWENMIKEAGNGNYKPLLIFLTAFPAIGEVVGDVRGLVGAKERPSWKEQPIQRLVENISWVGGMGIALDYLRALRYRGGSFSFLGGPTFGTVAAFGDAMGKLIYGPPALKESLSKKEEGKRQAKYRIKAPIQFLEGQAPLFRAAKRQLVGSDDNTGLFGSPKKGIKSRRKSTRTSRDRRSSNRGR